MSRFYTNVSTRGDKILYRGYENGKRVEGRIDYRPTLFVSTDKSSKYHTMDGRSVESFQPGSMSDCRDFILRHESVTGFDIYGNTDYVYQFIGDKFPDDVEYDKKQIKVAYLDIETTAENGFPQVKNPTERVNVIPRIVTGKLITNELIDVIGVAIDVKPRYTFVPQDEVTTVRHRSRLERLRRTTVHRVKLR